MSITWVEKEKTLKLEKNVKEEINTVIPGKNLIELTKILDDEKSTIEMHLFSNKVLFKFDNTVFQTRVLGGTFPDVERLVPTSFELEIKVNQNDFYNVIDRASLLTNERDKNIVKFECKGKQLKISSNSPEIGKVEEKMDIEKNEALDIKIAFSSRFMMDALRTIKSDNVVLNFNGDVKPIIIFDEKDKSVLQLILPIKTY